LPAWPANFLVIAEHEALSAEGSQENPKQRWNKFAKMKSLALKLASSIDPRPGCPLLVSLRVMHLFPPVV